MNYAIVIALVVVLGGASYYFMQQTQTEETATVETNQEQQSQEQSQATESEDDTVPEGMHRMPDGSLMENDAMLDMTIEGETSVSMDSEADIKVFNVTGHNFAFSMDEIRVQEGDTVTINFESTDGYHDWVVDEFGAATERVRENTPTSVTFVANKAGSYEFYCSVGAHRAQGMVGTLIVE